MSLLLAAEALAAGAAAFAGAATASASISNDSRDCRPDVAAILARFPPPPPPQHRAENHAHPHHHHQQQLPHVRVYSAAAAAHADTACAAATAAASLPLAAAVPLPRRPSSLSAAAASSTQNASITSTYTTTNNQDNNNQGDTKQNNSNQDISGAPPHHNYLALSPRCNADCSELIRRPSDVPLSSLELGVLLAYLLSLDPVAFADFQIANRAVADSDARVVCLLDRHVLRFQTATQPHLAIAPGIELSETANLTVQGKRQSPKFTCFLPPINDRYHLAVDTPSSGRIRKSPQPFTFRITYRVITIIRVIVMIEVHGGHRHFILINTESPTDPRLLPRRRDSWNPSQSVQDAIFEGHPFTVPIHLAKLRALLALKQGFNAVGIFREKGPPWEVQTLQSKVAVGETWDCSDVHAISTCLKLYLRESPPFNIVPPDLIICHRAWASSSSLLSLNTDTLPPPPPTSSSSSPPPEAAWSTLTSVISNSQSSDAQLILWTIDLMTLVAHYADSNQMGVKSIATAFAPSLFSSPDPNLYLRVLQHLVPFLTHLVQYRMQVLELGS